MAQDNTNDNAGSGQGTTATVPLGLPLHTRLGEFEILSVIGEGGFSIVYLAHDHQLQRTVAIKEYLPGAIAYRNADGIVLPRFEKYEGTFTTGLQSFLKEARILAQFEHHALIRIHRFWEQNGTAYMVMQYCQGKTMRQVLQNNPARGTDEVWLKQTLSPVLDALQLLHSRNYYHRDLSPDNIMILDSGAPMLLDFGAARQVIGDMTQALTVILKPGFAPIEQYADDESMRQGPWTDIYGVGAVLYFAVTGKAPTASVARLVKDPLKKLGAMPEPPVSAPFAHAVDHALALFPSDRPQSIEAFATEILTTDASAQPFFIPHTLSGAAVAASAASAIAASPAQSDDDTSVTTNIAQPKSDTGALSNPRAYVDDSALTVLHVREQAASAPSNPSNDLLRPAHEEWGAQRDAVVETAASAAPVVDIHEQAEASLPDSGTQWRSQSESMFQPADPAQSRYSGISAPAESRALSESSAGAQESSERVRTAPPSAAPRVATSGASGAQPRTSPSKTAPKVARKPVEVTSGKRPWGMYAGFGVMVLLLLTGAAYFFGNGGSNQTTVIPAQTDSEAPIVTAQAPQVSPDPSVPVANENAPVDASPLIPPASTTVVTPAASQPVASQATATPQQPNVGAGTAAPSVDASTAPASRPGAQPPAASATIPPTVPVTAASTPGSVDAALGQSPKDTTQPVETAPAASGKPGAYVRLSVKPWGKVSVDGVEMGASPPKVRIWLAEGDHNIVIENGDFQRYSTQVKVVDKKEITVSHKFGN